MAPRPSRKYLPYIFAITTLALVGIILGRVFSSRQVSPPPNYQEKLQIMAGDDKATLDDANATPANIYGALLRRAQQLDPYARSKASQFLQDPRPQIRQGALLALGYFDDSEAQAALRDAVRGTDAADRIASLKALGFRASPEREALVTEAIASKRLDENELVTAYDALLKLSKAPEIRERASRALMTVVERSPAFSVRSDALIRLTDLNPTYPALLSHYKLMLERNQDAPLHAMAIRHLAATGNRWLKGQLNHYAVSSDIRVRMATLQVIPTLCPEDRWKIIESRLWSEKDRNAQQVMGQILKILGSSRASALLERASKDAVFSSEEQASFQSQLQSLDRTKDQLSDQCSLQNKMSSE